MTQAPKRKLWFEAPTVKAVAPGSKWLRTRQAAAYLNIGFRTLEKLRSTDGGPPCRRIAGAVLYRRDELDRWADSRTYVSTSDQMSKEVSDGASIPGHPRAPVSAVPIIRMQPGGVCAP